MAVDYFTKWIEVEALSNIRDVGVKKFVLKNIVMRFGVPDSLISNNGLQFDSRAFCEFCSDRGIKNIYSTLAYPQSNGHAKGGPKSYPTFCGHTKQLPRDLQERLYSP